MYLSNIDLIIIMKLPTWKELGYEISRGTTILVVAGGAKMNLILSIEHLLNCLVKFIPASTVNFFQHIIHGAGMNFTKQFRFSMDIRVTSSSSSKARKCVIYFGRREEGREGR
jgi:hypothetical protein